LTLYAIKLNKPI